jgi:hypothetical protein
LTEHDLRITWSRGAHFRASVDQGFMRDAASPQGTSHAPPRANLERVLLLGCGFLGTRIARLAAARGFACLATTRDAAKLAALEGLGVQPLLLPQLSLDSLREQITPNTGLIVSYPPDGQTDARCAELARRAHSAVYVSSTGVYGDVRGLIDDRTGPSPDTAKAAQRLAAESQWRSASATVLRPAAIYGPGSGMHTRLRAGSARIAGDGSGFVCRIHVDDLAELCLACLEQRVGPETFVVADELPARQGDVVAYLANRMGLPVPPAVPLDKAPETLRHDRRIDASGIRRRLGVTLRYPTYREGFEACFAEESAGKPG